MTAVAVAARPPWDAWVAGPYPCGTRRAGAVQRAWRVPSADTLSPLAPCGAGLQARCARGCCRSHGGGRRRAPQAGFPGRAKNPELRSVRKIRAVLRETAAISARCSVRTRAHVDLGLDERRPIPDTVRDVGACNSVGKSPAASAWSATTTLT